MEQMQEQHPTERLVTFVEPRLAARVALAAKAADRSISAELRRILRASYLIEEKR